MPFIGTTPAQGFVSSVNKQSFTANGSTTSFTLSHPVSNANDLEVFVGNVRQEPTAAYTASGTTLDFGSGNAPPSGVNLYVIFKNLSQVTSNPPTGSVGNAQITDGAVTSAKLGTGSILQVQHFQLTTSQTVTGVQAMVDLAIPNFVVNITPRNSSSIMKLEAQLMYESANVAWSTMFFFFRDTTKLANTQASPGSRMIGIAGGVSALDSDNNSTPEMTTLTYFDTPNTTSAINYKLGVVARTTNNFFINRTITDTDSDSYDRGTSYMSVTEIAR